MQPILIEGVQGVSLRNGVVRLQCVAGGADGEDQVAVELAVPANRYDELTAELQNAAQKLRERIQEQNEATGEQEAAPTS
jgi:hypothetical protein